MVRRREHAAPPARFVDSLGDRHRGRDAVPLLRRDRPRRHQADERLLGRSPRHARRLLIVPAVSRIARPGGRVARGVREHPRDRRVPAGPRTGPRTSPRTSLGTSPRTSLGTSLRTAAGGPVRRAAQVAVVDEAEHAHAAERCREPVRIHGQLRQRVAAHGVQGGAAVPGDHLDVPVEQHPVSRLRPVPVAQRVPAVMRLRIGEHRHHVRRRRVGLDPDVGPSVQRPRVGAAPGHPALLARRLGAQRQREAGEGRARLPVIGPV